MAPLFSEKEERVGDQPHSLRGENLSWILDIERRNNYGDHKGSSLGTRVGREGIEPSVR